jgi:hypothetical protein
MRQLAEDARRQLLSNQNLPADRRNAALNAIQAEAERAMRETLGDQAYTEYSRGASWIRGLGANGSN